VHGIDLRRHEYVETESDNFVLDDPRAAYARRLMIDHQ
jgi:hypothetical protein